MLHKVLLSVVLGLIAGSALAVTFVPINGEVSVTTSSNRRSAAVIVSNNGNVTAQFCVSFQQPIAEPISISGRGQVIYAPQPIEGLPPGFKVNGPEPIAQSLTLIIENGTSYAFVAKGVKPIYPTTNVIVISNVSRQDWLGPNKTRRVPGVEACFSAGG